ncbi:MAG: ATP synthase F1 subunit gamma [Dehalococcoidia bacterium]|nr:ATP synthase F1 subunit gamma [Dehalococcoidia bacterium]
MPNTRQIRQRIRSVTSTQRITSAMELIAAAKMRRAQQRVLATRPYSTRLLDLIADIVARQSGSGDDIHPLMQVREPSNIGLILFTPDRGLCGGLNANLNRAAYNFGLEQEHPVSQISVGKKGNDFFSRRGRDIRAEFLNLGDFPEPIDTSPIARIVLEDYEAGRLDRVYLGYATFVNNAVQEPTIRQLLPVEPPAASENGASASLGDYEYEPDAATVLGGLLPRYVEMQIYQAALENAASEQSARMVAMRAATDAAGEMIDALTLEYNKARQETITKELLDLVGGVAALEKA